MLLCVYALCFAGQATPFRLVKVFEATLNYGIGVSSCVARAMRQLGHFDGCRMRPCRPLVPWPRAGSPRPKALGEERQAGAVLSSWIPDSGDLELGLRGDAAAAVEMAGRMAAVAVCGRGSWRVLRGGWSPRAD